MGPLAHVAEWQIWRDSDLWSRVLIGIVVALAGLVIKSRSRNRRQSLAEWVEAAAPGALSLSEVVSRIALLPWFARETAAQEYRGQLVYAIGSIEQIERVDALFVRVTMRIGDTERLATLTADRSRNPALLHAGPGCPLAVIAELLDVSGTIIDLSAAQDIRLGQPHRRRPNWLL